MDFEKWMDFECLGFLTIAFMPHKLQSNFQVFNAATLEYIITYN